MNVRNAFFNLFGDAESAVTREGVTHLLGASAFAGSEYINPSIPPIKLAQLMRSHPQHSPLPSFKANWLVKYMNPNPLITRKVLRQAVIDHEATGNCYFQFVRNQADVVLKVEHMPAINTRRMAKDTNRYCWLEPNMRVKPFNKGEIVHVFEYEIFQQLYGTPYWIGALQSILLGEDVRLFPRRFFKNGAHAGKLIATAGMGEDDKKAFESKMEGSKGIGAFKTITAHFTKFSKLDELIKVINLGEGTEKIDFSKLGEMSATDVLEAWRIRPELAGMMPENPGGTGDLDKIIKMYHVNEMIPLQQHFQDALNQHLSIPLTFTNPYKNNEED